MQAPSRSPRTRAIERLMRDLRELQAEPCRTVCAVPMENDMLCWHGNLCPLSGPYAGSMLHIVMTFGEDYPASPPEVRLCQTIPHPNVFGDWICLDMLKRYTSSVPYTGWSSAYSVQSILLQLQAFLFAENIPQESGRNVKAYVGGEDTARQRIDQFVCADCGHSAARPYPPIPEEDAFVPRATAGAEVKTETEKEKEKEEKEGAEGEEGKGEEKEECWMLGLPVESLLHILQYLQNKHDIIAAANSCTALATIVQEYCLLELQLQSLICFHSKRTYEEDVLGVGVSLERFPNDRSRLKAIHTSLDILSYRSFTEDAVRMSVWKESFSEFVPLVISPDHFGRAKNLIIASLANIAGEGAHPTWQRDLNLQAKIVMRVLPKIMNSFVVSLMKTHGGAGGAPPPNSQVLSERALEGYCSFHHMLLALATENPEIERLANEAVGLFATPLGRSKELTPDLGEWMINLTLSTARWEDVVDHFLDELFVRNARWILQDAPYLASLTTARESAVMIDDAFTSTLVSRRLIMFQVYFLKNIGRINNQSWRDSLTVYRRTMGRPTQSMKVKLHAASKAILNVASWDEYFDRLSVPRMSGQQLTQRLGRAIVTSAAKGYHRPLSSPARAPRGKLAGLTTPRYLHQPPIGVVAVSSSSSSAPVTSDLGKRGRSRSRSRSRSPLRRVRQREADGFPLLPTRDEGRRDRRRREDSRDRSPHRAGGRPAKRHRRGDSRSPRRSRSRSRSPPRHRGRDRQRRDYNDGLYRELSAGRRDGRSRERRRHG